MADTPTPMLADAQPLNAVDPAIAGLIDKEAQRQHDTLEMIASENHTSPAVMEACGSCLTNKYCEGYPGKRYYSGCEFYDQVENLAIDRAKELFGCDYANVQPHSGANANLAVFFALLNPGDTYASIELSDGGHLTHGAPVNISGKWFNSVHYPLHYEGDKAGWIDYDAVEKLCVENKPKIIICGYSAYPRTIDFPRFRAIADKCGALLMADIAHIAGLVAGGAHPSPFPHCDIVTTTTHKTLRGPRGGLALTNDADIAKKIDKAVFPGTQGGPLMHIIAGKAVAFGEALKPEFKQYAEQTVNNARALAAALTEAGWKIQSGGSDNHLALLDLRDNPVGDAELTGKVASGWLEEVGIITNKNTVAKDERSPFVTSGVRLGTPALTTRGFGEAEIRETAGLIDQTLRTGGDEAKLNAVAQQVKALCDRFPMH